VTDGLAGRLHRAPPADVQALDEKEQVRAAGLGT
jgi:hypothetical protein